MNGMKPDLFACDRSPNDIGHQFRFSFIDFPDGTMTF
jgi:hypothetical protein